MYKDLSVYLTNDTPVYPGDPTIQIEPAGIIENDGYTDHSLSLNTHVGTHMDAPAHMIAGGKTLDRFPIQRFIGRGILIDVVNDEFKLADVQNAGVRPGDVVLFNTGWDKKYYDARYFEAHPSIPEDIAHFLVDAGVSIVGVDMGSPDHDPFPIHKILLGGDILIVENLTGLGELSGNFEIIALPIKLQVDGAPCRVVAKFT